MKPKKIEAGGIIAIPGLFSIRAETDAAPTHNPRFTLSAYNGGAMRVAGWTSPVVVDLQGLTVAAQKLPVYANHMQDVESLLGQTDKIEIVSGRLSAEGSVTGRSETCQGVLTHAKNGFEWQASIGATVDASEFIARDKTVLVNGITHNGPLYVARRASLGEISFVALGADTSTSARIAANAARNGKDLYMSEFEKWLEAEYGLAVAELDEGQTAKFQAKFADSKKPTGAPAPAPVVPAAQPTPIVVATADQTIAADRAKIAAEWDRMAKVQAVAAKHPALMAKAIAEGWDEATTKREVELAELRAGRPQNVAPAVGGGYSLTAKAIEAGVLLSCGISDERLVKDRDYGEQIVDAARRLPRSLGPQGMMELAARMEGVALPFDRKSNDWIRAAFSTVSLPNILSNLQNKLLLEGYNSVEQAWRQICRKSSLNDFKVHTRVRLTSDMMFEPLGPDGEIKHGKLDEQAYTIQGQTYGKMQGLTRVMIINDDLSAMQDIPLQLGIGAADKINDMVWSGFMGNQTAGASFTPADKSKGNVIDGAGSVLCHDALADLYNLFRKQTKPNGRPLGYLPEILLVPSELAVTAERLCRSSVLIPQLVTALAANSGTPADNFFAGKLTPVSTAFLSNASYTGNSSIMWYLLCNPLRLHVIEIGFLNGQEMPVIERAEPDFDTLGIEFRAFFDFGVGTGEYRAIARSKAAA